MPAVPASLQPAGRCGAGAGGSPAAPRGLFRHHVSAALCLKRCPGSVAKRASSQTALASPGGAEMAALSSVCFKYSGNRQGLPALAIAAPIPGYR